MRADVHPPFPYNLRSGVMGLYRSEEEMKKVEADREKLREMCRATFGTDEMVVDENPRVVKSNEALTMNYYGVKSSRF